jgi:hypothetical protein
MNKSRNWVVVIGCQRLSFHVSAGLPPSRPVLGYRNPHRGAQFFTKKSNHLVIIMRFPQVFLVYLALRVLPRKHKEFQ